jgi:hypothetical protein
LKIAIAGGVVKLVPHASVQPNVLWGRRLGNTLLKEILMAQIKGIGAQAAIFCCNQFISNGLMGVWFVVGFCVRKGG